MRCGLQALMPVLLLALLGVDQSIGICASDCDDDGAVTVSEIVAAVNVALGRQPLATCPEGDSNRDGAVTADELIQAVSAALTGCPAPDGDLTVVTLNLLHGAFCQSTEPGTEACRIADRVDLLFGWIEQNGCPDIVTLQEIWEPFLPLIEEHLAGTCPFTYEMVFHPLPPSPSVLDQEMILTRHPVVDSGSESLYPWFRHFLHARIAHPLGVVDVVTTHLASGSDQGGAPCGANCPPGCLAAGTETIRDCQAAQLMTFVADHRNSAMPTIITGDFNTPPESALYARLLNAGWLDAYVLAGNPECDTQTGAGCTSGREDKNLSDLESRENNETERIDYIFVIPPGESALCWPSPDSGVDDDNDGTATGTFADTPNPFAPCGPLPEAICWPSDHVGVAADLNCLD